MKKRNFFFVIIICFFVNFQKLNGQDSANVASKPDNAFITNDIFYKLNHKKLIVPAVYLLQSIIPSSNTLPGVCFSLFALFLKTDKAITIKALSWWRLL
ncbi:MAG: hypothetical protein QM594_03235 [Niabella sp.]